MSRLITIAVPEDWRYVNEELLAKGDNLEFLTDLEEVLIENNMLVAVFAVGDVIEVDSDDFLGKCIVTKDTTDGSIFLVQEDTELPYGTAIQVTDDANISLAEMDLIVGSENYSW